MFNIFSYIICLIVLNTVAVSTVFQPEANGLMWNVLGTGKFWLFIFITPLVILSIDLIFKIFSDLLFPNPDTEFMVSLYNYIEKQDISEPRKSIEVSPQNLTSSARPSHRSHSDYQLEELEDELHNSVPISPSNVILAKPRTLTFRENDRGDTGESKYIVGEENESQPSNRALSHGLKITQQPLNKIQKSEDSEPVIDPETSERIPSTERKYTELIPTKSRNSS